MICKVCGKDKPKHEMATSIKDKCKACIVKELMESYRLR